MTAPAPPPALHPHQRDAVAAVRAALRAGGRGQVVHACGAGKTITAEAAAAALHADHVLVLLPSLALVAQTVHAWTARRPAGAFTHLVVCSDDTVSSDDYIQHPRELDLDVTTDPAAIAAYLAGTRHPDRPKVVFATYQSSARVGEAQTLLARAGDNHRFDLAICDEAHRLAGDPDRDYATVLHDARLHANRRLFLTATPRLSASDGTGSHVGMDDPDVFGPVLHRYTFAQAIADGRLVDYRVLVLAYTEDRLAGLAADIGRPGNRPGSRGGEPAGPSPAAARNLAAAVATGMAATHYRARRLISFHSSVAAGRDFARDLPAVLAVLPPGQRPAGPVRAAHINGRMGMAERRERMRLLDHDTDSAVLVSNARCLTEGVDVPALDAVVIADPRGSRTDLVQIVGRALRTAPGKTTGTVVVPVVLQPGQSPAAALAGGAFEQVWHVLAALRDHDEDLAHELDLARRAVRLGGPVPSRVTGRVVLELPDGYPESFAAAVRLRLVERTGTTWADGLTELDLWAAGHGHPDVPQSTVTASGFALGDWLAARRKDIRAGRLAGPRRDELLARGVSLSPREEQFRAGLRAFDEWVRENGHGDVPARHVTRDGFRLGAWVGARRRDAADGSLPAGHRAELKARPMVWDPAADRFAARLAEVAAYKQAHDGQDPPQTWVSPAGHPTGGWLRSRRADRRAGRLPREQERALERAGVRWEPFDEQFEMGLAVTAAWWDEHRRRPAARAVSPGGFPVGSWLAKRRRDSRAGTIPAERSAALTLACPGWDT